MGEPGFNVFLDRYKGKQAKFLEVGVYEGDCSKWLLGTYADAHLTAVDTFGGSAEHKAAGIDCSTLKAKYEQAVAPFFGRVTIFQGPSHHVLRRLEKIYDFVYIDASHEASDVFIDGALSWLLLKQGGILAFDDYDWHFRGPLTEPKIAIDAFLKIFEGKFKLLHLGHRAVLEKLVA